MDGKKISDKEEWKEDIRQKWMERRYQTKIDGKKISDKKNGKKISDKKEWKENIRQKKMERKYQTKKLKTQQMIKMEYIKQKMKQSKIKSWWQKELKQ